MSSHKGEFYFCEICGVEVEVKNGGDGSLKCCGQAMKSKKPYIVRKEQIIWKTKK